VPNITLNIGTDNLVSTSDC